MVNIILFFIRNNIFHTYSTIIRISKIVLFLLCILLDMNSGYMADDPNSVSSPSDEKGKCNRKIDIINSGKRNDRQFYISSTSMGTPFSTATNCTIEITSLQNG